MKKYISIITILCLTIQFCYGQYSISGYIDTEHKNKTVYLSLLRYNELVEISFDQILFSTKIDSTGYFEFKGQFLSEKNKCYRIHANYNTSESSLNLVNSDSTSNFYNFIFSNRDTVFFPKTKNFWFQNSVSTSMADKEFLKLNEFIQDLTRDLSQYQRLTLSETKVLTKQIRQYAQDSVHSSLVKLLALYIIETKGFDFHKDFMQNANFYDNLQKELLNDYGKTSYYVQFKDRMSKILYDFVSNKYSSVKKWSYLLCFLVFTLSVIIFLLFRKIKVLKQNNVNDCTQNLTQQEVRIAKMIVENKTNKEIADELFVSLSTVKTHIGNLYAKVNVSSRKGFQIKFKNHIWY